MSNRRKRKVKDIFRLKIGERIHQKQTHTVRNAKASSSSGKEIIPDRNLDTQKERLLKMKICKVNILKIYFSFLNSLKSN